jgi:hypothetical protein
MRRKPSCPEEGLFVEYLPHILRDLLGAPESGKGGDEEAHYLGCNINVGDNAERRGSFVHWKTMKTGAGFDMLPPLGLTRSDIEAWLRGVRPTERTTRETDEIRKQQRDKKFAILLDNSRADDGRVAAYLARRKLPAHLAARVEITTVPRRNRSDEWEPGAWALVAWATDEQGIRQAGQVLEVAPNGDPKKGIDGKKVRLTYARETGWAEAAAFRIPAMEGHEGIPVVMVEGTEDALAVRDCGYVGPIIAVLGKGNFSRHAPSAPVVILLADRDVEVTELDKIAAFHVSAGRVVRRGILPEGLKDAGEAPEKDKRVELREAIENAAIYESPSGALNHALSGYPLDDTGDARFEAEIDALAKRLGLGKNYIRRRRKEHREAKKRRDKEQKEADEARQAQGDGDERTFIVAWPDRVENIREVMDELLAHLKRYIVTPYEHHLAMVLLWVLHTQAFLRWKITPRLYLRSVVNESGKTTVLNVVLLLTPGAEQFIKSSGPGLYRGLDQAHKKGEQIVPLIDEVDGMFTDSTIEDANLKKLFNNNETGRFSKKILLVEEHVIGRARKHVAQRLHTMAPLAIAGLDRLPSAMKSRCIEITLLRFTPEISTGLDEEKLGEYASKLRRWVQDNIEVLERDPDLPKLRRKPSPRMVDKWKPLIAIAKGVGGDWPDYVRRSMDRSVRREQAMNKSLRIMLDIRRIFDARRGKTGHFPDVILSSELAEALVQEINGKDVYASISNSMHARARWLAGELDADWDIAPRRSRPISADYPGAGANGTFYFRADFESAWTRHGIDDAREQEDDLSEEMPAGFTYEPRRKTAEAKASTVSSSADETTATSSEPVHKAPKEGLNAVKRDEPVPSAYKQNLESGISDTSHRIAEQTPKKGDSKFSSLDKGASPSRFTAFKVDFPVFERGALAGIPRHRRAPHGLGLRVWVDEDGIPTWTLAPGAAPMPLWVRRLAEHLKGLKADLEAARKTNGHDRGGEA